ncbi:bola protein [Leucosporidium creatinivorum]|uniref:Bola protein n=1 Tax=Leucosporidium creatinivorum TaxID=106004 RepID=A0A1Y2FJG9_9BASI|nr:bola protein [Leucosporidium creatinivorum]
MSVFASSLRTALARPILCSAAPLPIRTFTTTRPTPIASTSRLLQASSSEAPASLTDGEKALKDKLEKELDGAKVDVQDVSGGCGSFYAISISHPSFKGLTTMKQHRIVNGLLAEEIKGMHGLQLKTSAE